MEYVIGGLVVIICLYTAGIFVKKKYYKDVDLLEARKIEMSHSPVQHEMSKVKHLKMTGQTEELFEKWRSKWDDIAASRLPEVEEFLIDAEESIDKYRFRKAKMILSAIKEHLDETEGQIKELLSEIQQLIDGEKQSREQIGQLKEIYRKNKKTLLAHRHNFGKAEKVLEELLEEVNSQFQKYDELTGNGDYLIAMELVEEIKERLDYISGKMKTVPDLLVECRIRIPSQVHELEEGYREMVKQGYILDHIQLENETKRIEKSLSTYISFLENLETDEVEKGLEEIRERLDFLYDLLEEEVTAKQFIHENKEDLGQLVRTTQEAYSELKEEVENVKDSYHLSEVKLEEQEELEKTIEELAKRYELLEHKINDDQTAQTLLKEELAEIKTKFEEKQAQLQAFSEHLQALRKDELEAREKVQELSKKISESIRMITKSNLPGLSEDFISLIDEAKESVAEVKSTLEEVPLDIPRVQESLDKAESSVEQLYGRTSDLVETVMLAEKVIQYGNRYRSRYPSVHAGLLEAENSFRGYDYQAALEQAAAAIEKVEPGAIKKIENLIKEEII